MYYIRKDQLFVILKRDIIYFLEIFPMMNI